MTKKTRLFLSPIAEERWINAIEAEGYRLAAYNRYICTYHFEKLDQNSTFQPYTKLDYRDFMSKDKYQEYLTFIEDAGWVVIESSRWGGTQYFQTTPKTETAELFSDAESKQAFIKRCINVAMALFVSFMMYFWIFLPEQPGGFAALVNPKLWYLTEGLWTMPSDLKWKAILFETPFALLRAFPIYFFLISIVYYCLRIIMLDKERKKTM